MWTNLNFRNDIVARKEHTCYLCQLKIAKGETYCLNEGVESGAGFLRTRMHNKCFKLTAGWDEDHWMMHEASEFRELLAEKGE